MTGPRLGPEAPTLPGHAPTKEDYAALERSYINRETADRALLRRLAHLEARGLYSYHKGDCSGLFFPNVWPLEPDKLRPSCLRLDKARGKRKYLAELERGNHLYVCPGTPAGMLTDVSLPVAITEGAKKGLCLTRLATEGTDHPRWLAASLNGVYGWRDQHRKDTTANGERVSVPGPITDFDYIAWQDRTVLIIFDQNTHTSKNVRMARDELRRELARRGAVVEYVDLPADIEGINGIDDLAQLWGGETTLGYIEEARKRKQPTPWDMFKLDEDGVYYIDPDPEKHPLKICGRLVIVARTRSTAGENWGCLLRWSDDDSRIHTWAMPNHLLAGSSDEYRRKLLDGGLYVNPTFQARERLTQYLLTQGPTARVQCVDHVGWHGDIFVLPDVSIRAAHEEEVVYQAEDPANYMQASGTVEEWREHIGRLCSGNSRLVLVVSIALAGPLLGPLHIENGGLHLVNKSSIGKSTALVVAASVMGTPDIKSTWRATANGLEAAAAASNDLTLILDEIGQADPREVADVVYMVSNGSGKSRMSRTIHSRRRLTWRLLYISSGELTLADHALSAGKRVRAGAEVRLLNIAADAGAGMGLFQDLHSCASADRFADLLKERSAKYYGAAIRAFIHGLVQHRAEIERLWPGYRSAFISEYTSADAPGEVIRSAGRLALVAYAGEIASQWGITGWAEDESKRAAGSAFQSWLEARGGEGRADDDAAIRQVRRYIETHGSSRFESDTQLINSHTGDEIRERVINRVGYRESGDDGEYWFLPESWRAEVCAGFDYRAVCRALDDKGFLTREHPSWMRKARVHDHTQTIWVYAVKASIIGGER